jgi:predicted Zn-dependent peptidase
MKRVKNILLLFFGLLFISDAVLGEFKSSGLYLEKNVFTATLSNGIKVVMLNRGNTPTLALITSFRVGSVDESYRMIGMAHMLEHMLFKGTDTIGTKDFKREKKILDEIEAIGETLDRLKLKNPDNTRISYLKIRLKALQKEHRKFVLSSPYSRIYSSNGGVGFNAFTSRDRTAYVIELPASKLEIWARLESERLLRPVMREYYLERDTVLEERSMRYESSGTGKLFEKFIAAAFIAHPYRHPTIGWESNIQSLSIRDLKSFYWSNYIPSRMTITIVGRHDVKKTLRILEKYFSRIKKRPEPPELAVREPQQEGERRVVLRLKFSPYLVIGWHKPTFPSKEDFASDVISGLLTDGKTSRLYRSLVLEKKIATSVDSWNGYPGVRYNNLFVIEAAPRHPHTVEQLERAIYQEIEEMRNNLKKEEIERVLNRIEASMVFDLDTNMGIARLLSYYQTIFEDWRYVVRYMDRIKAIGIDDIKKTLDTYFVESNRTVGVLIKREKDN